MNVPSSGENETGSATLEALLLCAMVAGAVMITAREFLTEDSLATIMEIARQAKEQALKAAYEFLKTS